MSPTSPKAYRKETSFVYASGWPPAFIGDLYYYVQDYDLTDQAHKIDTNQVGVHILSGEYDYSGTSELGKAASDAIKGSSWAEMKGVGHFPMSENPKRLSATCCPSWIVLPSAESVTVHRFFGVTGNDFHVASLDGSHLSTGPVSQK